ncbi:MAG: divergent polysaccharide deacetylase family protein, partial [Candidatus Omnitrophica bacterium]|nr:divergent polysaccharide deacetylase family protein [Candidatus Omnitrophota bacterium]
ISLIVVAIIVAVFGLIFLLNRPSKPTSKSKSEPINESTSKPISKPKGLVAFVIDDWGYNRNNIDLVFQIQRPITISILPNLHYSKAIAETVKENGEMYDVILHLPLESDRNMAAEVDTIRCNMEEDEISSVLQKDIESIPGIIGVSSHQGSKATEDERVMEVVLNELKKRKLFFLDSLTTTDSVCLDIARDIGVKYTRRDIFLDITDQTDFKNFESYIKQQIRKLARIALEKGSAVGIGHNKKITIEAIKDSVPKLEEEGIKIVPLKELVQ